MYFKERFRENETVCIFFVHVIGTTISLVIGILES